VEPNEGSATIATSSESVVDALNVKEWEVGMFHNEVAATQGYE
jgi:indole-3-glycerol phosphate synthase